MEIDPEHQKTLPDFLITQKELGIAIVDILSLKKRGREALLQQGRPRDRGEAHLQPLHRGRAGAQGHHAALRPARGTRCRVGRTSQLVLPHQQVLHSLPQPSLRAEDVVPRREPERPGRQRELHPEAALFVRRERASSSLPPRPTSTPFPPASATTTSCRSVCASSRSSPRRTA